MASHTIIRIYSITYVVNQQHGNIMRCSNSDMYIHGNIMRCNNSDMYIHGNIMRCNNSDMYIHRSAHCTCCPSLTLQKTNDLR